jgi:hypothetical protein
MFIDILLLKLSGALASLRKATFSFAMSVRLSTSPHETTRLPLDGFCLNLTFDLFPKICLENSSFTKI